MILLLSSNNRLLLNCRQQHCLDASALDAFLSLLFVALPKKRDMQDTIPYKCTRAFFTLALKFFYDALAKGNYVYCRIGYSGSQEVVVVVVVVVVTDSVVVVDVDSNGIVLK